MKNLAFPKNALLVLFILLALFNIKYANAQRLYATSEQHGATGVACVDCLVANAANAADGNVQTFSSLNVVVGVAAQTYQALIFPSVKTAGTPVTVKLGSGDKLLSLTALGGVYLQAYNGNAAIGTPVAVATLLTALSNNNQVEVSIKPTQTYDRIRVTVNGGLAGVLANTYLYDAFTTTTGAANCSAAIDELHGISAGLLGLGTDIGGVANPQNAIDGNINTASTLNAGVGLLGAYAQQTIIYSNQSVIGDSVRMTLSIPQALIDVGLLSNISVATYLGNTYNGDQTPINASLLNLRLLDLSSNRRKVTVTFAPTKVFDRVQLTLGGVANVLSTLDLYEAVRLIPRPVASINGILGTTALISPGNKATLTAGAVANTSFHWYTQATGGTAVANGASYTTPILNANTTYYVSASRTGCTDESERTQITLNVGNPVTPPVVPAGIRTYANAQQFGTGGLCLGCTVLNPANASDGNVQSYSTFSLPVGVGGQVYQDLTFPGGTKPAGTPLSVKLGTGDNLLNLTALGGITIQAYNGNTPVGSPASAATLVSVLSNNNQVELSFAPTAPYDKVRVTLNGGLVGALSSLYLYEGFVTTAGAATCNTAIDELHGISSALLNLGLNVGGVVNPQNAIDGDLNTASTLNAGVGLLGAYAQQTVIFSNPSVIGDSVRITVSVPEALLQVGLLAGSSVNTYYGNTDNNDQTFLSSSLLQLRLLDLTGNRRKVVITFVPTKVFDRVQLRLGGVANVLSTLDLYEIQRVIAKPVIKINNAVSTNASICTGTTATLTATAVANTVFHWYTQETGGSPVFTGAAFTTPVLTANATYYVAAMRAGCTDESDRTKVTVTVNAVPAAPVIATNTVSVCSGQTANFAATSVAGVTINWYSAATGGTLLHTGDTYTTAAITATKSFYAEAVVTGGTCASATRTKVTATLSAAPVAPTLTAANVTICSGSVATLAVSNPAAGITYTWYTAATGGTPVFTGPAYTTDALAADATYYVEAVNATGCSSAQRTTATVTVTPLPAAPTVSAANANLSAGQKTTISVTSPQAGLTYNWYTSANAASPIFTGTAFETPLLYTNTTYYVSAVNAGGCPSATRTAVTINVTINTNAPCTFANQQTVTVNGLCVGCNVANPALATDADTTTASTINVLAGLLGGNVQQELRFQQPGFTGDTIKLVLQNPNGLLGAAVLGNIGVTLYNGATQTANYQLNNALIKIFLLAGSSNKYAVYIPATGAYDRMTISINSGVASVLTPLNIYYASQQFPKSVFNPTAPEICKGSSAVVNITSPANGTFTWYNAPTGGTVVHTGSSYTTPALNANTTYYVEYTRGSCAGTVRFPVTILVDDVPAAPTVTAQNVTITSGQTATLNATASNGATIQWYDAATGGNLVHTGNPFTTPVLTANKIYYAATALGSCVSATRTPVNITVQPIVIPTVSVTPPTVALNAGHTTSFTATSTTPGVTFTWYTTPTGGTSIYTGATYTTPPQFANTTYYAEATVTATGVKSTTRAPGAVTINNQASSPVPCDAAIDQTNTTSGLLCVGCAVLNAGGAVDADRNTFSQLNVPIGLVASYASQTLRFANAGIAGDSVVVELGVPGTLASVSVLSQIQIGTYNGATFNNDYFSVNGSLINIQLLSGTNRFRVAFKATKAFDRVEVKLNAALAGVFSALNVYDASQSVAAPVIAATSVSTCSGSPVTISATVPANVIVKWYTSATGGTAVGTGANFTTPALTASTTYYAEASRSSDGCAQTVRTPVNINVTTIPAAPVVATPNLTVCAGQTATFNVTPVSGVTYGWYSAATGGTLVHTGNSFTTAAINATTSYYVQAVSGGSCVSTTRTQVTATLAPPPTAPTLSSSDLSICDGSVATLAVSNPDAATTYNWYTTATGGAPVFTGPTYTTAALHNNTSYYVEAVNAGGCTSATRAQANVTVVPLPANPTLATNNTSVAAGQKTTIGVTNAQTGVTYNWYTSANAATPVFTGTTFQTPLLYSNTTYYVSGVNGTGCTSASRTSITINVTIDTNAPCTFANAQTVTVNGVCIGCGVTNPALSTDADTTTASTINVLAGLIGGYAQQELRFQQLGFAGDTIKLVLQNPNGLLSAAVLGNIQVRLFNGATQTASLVLNSGLIKVYLLAGSSNKYAVYIPATAAYDRITVRINSGVASLLTPLNIYYAAQQFPKPVFNPTAPEICKGSSAVININSPANGTFTWYDAPVGGTVVNTGTSYTTPALTANTTYYVEYSRGSCASTVRFPVSVIVDDAPPAPTVTAQNVTITAGQTATLNATASNGATIQWFDAPTGGNLVFTGNPYVTPVLTATKTYYAGTALGNCVSATRTPVIITVVPVVIPDVNVNPPTVTVSPGQTTSFTASSTTPGAVFNWFTTPTGGTTIFTGATYTTQPQFNNTVYYAESSIPATGAKSATRATGIVTVNQQGTNPVPCDAAIDQTNTTSGVLCVGCGVLNAGGSVDADRNTFSQLNVPVGLLNAYASQTLRFANTAIAGDSVIVELGVPGTLASVSVLSQIQIGTYKGATFNNDYFSVNGSLINIQLLSGTSRFRVAFKAAHDFDRVEVRLNAAVAGVFSALNVYDASQSVPAPVIAASPVTTCAGSQATLTATAPANVTVRWYTSATGGSPVFTGATFTTPALTASTTYYAEASRTADGCSQAVRTPVQVNVTPPPAAPVVAVPNTTVCSGQPATFAVTAVNGTTYNWYSAATGGTLVHTGNTFTTAALTATTSYYVEAVNGGQCSSSARTKVTANVTATPVDPTVSQASTQTCSGSSVTLSASSTQPGVTFTWYTSATGGTPVHTGAQFVTPALTANTSYYVEASTGTCTSANRAKADVIVNPAPVAPTVTVNAAGGQITSGQTAQLSATSTTANVTFNWYTSAAGGTAVHTGATFTTPALTTNTTYYVEAVSNATGCISTTRTPVTVIVNPVFSTSCDFASTQTNSVSGVACLLCGVTGADNSVDTDTTNFSQLTLGVGAVGYVGQKLIFGDAGLAGDTVTVKIKVPVNLASVGVLSQLQIGSFNGNTDNGDRIALSNTAIKITILAGGQTALVKFVPKAAYNAVEVRLTTTVSLFNSLNIYYATKQVPIAQLTAKNVNICAGGTATFAVANPVAGVTYKWYSLAAGGTLLHTGNTYTTGVLNTTTTVYVESSRTSNSCPNPNRVAATANVTPAPVNPVLAQTAVSICSGDAVTLSVTNAGGATVNWYDAPTGGTLVFTGANYQVTPIATVSYYAELINATCTSPSRTQATITVNPRPAAPGVQSANVQVCPGSTATLAVLNPMAGVNYVWYSAATGGTALHTGNTYTTAAITQDQTFYVEAVNATTSCSNNGARTSVNVTVTNQLTAPVLSAATTTVCSGGTATLSVQNPVNGLTYKWYTAATGGAPVFTGSTFTINNLTADVSYFVESSNSSGCVSDTRARADITVTPIPNAPQVQASAGGLNICAGESASLSIVNPQTGVVYRWYTAATGGTLLFTGTQFNTPVLAANTTYYVEASQAGNCNASSRTSVTVTVNPMPADPVLASANTLVCLGSPATLKIQSPVAGITYQWFSDAAQTTKVFEGTTYTTGPITANTTYYVAAVNASGCQSANLTSAQVTIQAAPSAPVVANGNTVQTCVNSTVTLNISNPQAALTYNWYSAANGGTPLFTGTSFTTPALAGNVTYYVEAVNSTGCTSTGRTSVSINVNQIPTPPTVTAQGGGNTVVCSGGTITLVATSTTAGVSFNWYTAATGGQPVFTGATYTTPPITAATTYYVEAVNTGNCVSTTRTAVQVTIGNTTAPTPQVDAADLSVCQNSAATIHITNPVAGTTYNWYSVATGGSSLYTGTAFTTPALSANTTYYVQASNSQNCNASARLAVNVVIVPQPNTPVPTLANVPVCVGGSATLSVQSPQAGVIYKWYSNATRTNLLFTGPTYNTDPIQANTSFYVDASNGSCSSSSVATVQVSVVAPPSAPLLVSNAVSACVGAQAQLSISNPQNGFTYNWYTSASATAPVYTGTVFTTPSLSATTNYYAEAVNGTGCSSTSRTSATVSVIASPGAPTVDAPNAGICPGSTATLNVSNNTNNATIRWYTVATGGTAIATGNSFTTPALNQNTTYYVEASNANGCNSGTRTSVTVQVLQKLAAPVVSVGETTPTTITFNWPAVQGATGYEISLNNGSTFTSVANNLSYQVTGLQPLQSATIVVRALGASACQLSDNSAAVTGTTTNPLGNGIFIPNAFTPNGDGNNDTFLVYGNLIKSMNMSIYDQWGGLLFKSVNQSAGWDGTYKGTAQPVGVYVYYVEATLANGEVIKRKGTINLLR
ncbi:gliding motility-associated C-terminal domain-containing protein [Mucilaginibacter celer]|uniref:Gliding motility-associated C-terminal domain-containing protein n=1 Tax=Mucilaginibacter celer TaxID=2305508 RepID=A0A494VQ48_9SPHI|nr:gliding motility-associated C-terminal domain-containing protein [Mucilaginibacter celer]AYL96439.1 gliding motility-associated C-terminal domain-containing protein [Mucilaginibacter celer]